MINIGEESLYKLCQYQAYQCPKLLNKYSNTAFLCEYSEIHWLAEYIRLVISKDISTISSESVIMEVMDANSYIHASLSTMENNAFHIIIDRQMHY